ncbi:MAG: response regulator [Bacteroidia bacterium]|nr:response regulator [Bacteroidia bacterium]
MNTIKSLKVLILEDSQSDADLMLRELKKSGLNFTGEIVHTRHEFVAALDEFKPEIILSDYTLPNFDGKAAFFIKQEKTPDIPFIIVSGTIGEENAVELIKSGVTDYVLKDKLYSLIPKIVRAFKEEREKKEKREADSKLKSEHEKLLESEAKIRSFAKHLNQVLEEERAHLAREIHDELGQRLIAVIMELDSFKGTNNDLPPTNEKVNQLIADVEGLVDSMRNIATQLRPGILDSLGLIPSIEWLAKEFQKKTKLTCQVKLNGINDRFEENISTCFFRICQESLTNITKHAQASKVIIETTHANNELSITISDNGQGIASDKLKNPFSMGLLGMRERAKLLGADLNIISRPNSGTTVRLKVKTA